MKSQIGASKVGRGGPRYLPMVFTEYGVLMLSSVLNSPRAISVNIQIMRTFARIRQMLADNTELRIEIEQIKGKIRDQDMNIEIVFKHIDELLAKKPKPEITTQIGFNKNEEIFFSTNTVKVYHTPPSQNPLTLLRTPEKN